MGIKTETVEVEQMRATCELCERTFSVKSVDGRIGEDAFEKLTPAWYVVHDPRDPDANIPSFGRRPMRFLTANAFVSDGKFIPRYTRMSLVVCEECAISHAETVIELSKNEHSVVLLRQERSPVELAPDTAPEEDT